MRVSRFIKRALFCENVKLLHHPRALFLSGSSRCSNKIIHNYGNKVAGNNLKNYSTKKQQRYPKTSYNSTYKYGQPHVTSNIPSIEFNVTQNRSEKEKAFREYKQDLMSWHHRFWLLQNEKFNKEKKEYLQRRENENTMNDGKERADDLSLFYKEFLDRNFDVHFKYQMEWYKKHFVLLWYGIQVNFDKLFKRLTAKKNL